MRLEAVVVLHEIIVGVGNARRAAVHKAGIVPVRIFAMAHEHEVLRGAFFKKVPQKRAKM